MSSAASTVLFYSFLMVRDLLSVGFLDSSTTNLVDFCQNAQAHFAPQKSLTLEAWNASLPTEEEKQQMRTLLLRLYYMPTFEGKAFFLDEYPALAPWISISQIQDYVVIHEKFPPSGGLFPRNWGLVALCEPRACSRILHHSAVHFDSEGSIYEEAVYVAQKTKSRSLCLHGACRYALKDIVPSPCNSKYTITDGAHNDNTMFYLWSSTLLEASKSRKEEFAFVQWHGMAETSCTGADAFVSIGTAKHANYGNKCSAVKIQEVFNYVAAPLVCSTPLDDSTCKLIASDNPLGRLINGVSPKNVCFQKAIDENVRGEFLHIEQKESARRAVDKWSQAFRFVFSKKNGFAAKFELV